MPTLLLLAALPLAHAGKWDDAPTDVVVRADIPAPADRVHRTLADLKSLAELLPADCAKGWAFTSTTRGVGSHARVTYTFGPLKRTLTAQVVNDEPGRLWRIDHDNDKKGFFIQFTYPPPTSPDRTTVELTTPLNPPPWPLKGAFFKEVRPAWEDCYQRLLQNLQAKVAQP